MGWNYLSIPKLRPLKFGNVSVISPQIFYGRNYLSIRLQPASQPIAMPGVRHGYRSSSTSSDAPSPAPGTVLIEAGEYSPPRANWCVSSHTELKHCDKNSKLLVLKIIWLFIYHL